MSVVRGDARRRWSIVAAAVLAAGLAPVAVGARPATGSPADPTELRNRVLASATQPYEGYVESDGGISLPPLPELGELTGLLGSTTRLRAWYASPTAWRVATLEPTGEHDIYRTSTATFVWDFERNLVTQVVGEAPIRLPWAYDFLPPDLVRRILRSAAPGDPVTALATRRVAGIAAAGFRLAPSDPGTTVGHIDIWADLRTGLPLQVEISGRGEDRPVFTSRFLEVNQSRPAPDVLVPPRPDSAGFVTTDAPDVAATINEIAPYPIPSRLAGLAKVSTLGGITGVAGYGDGLSTFVVLPLPGRLGRQAIGAARDAGGLAVPIVSADAYETRTSLLTTLVVRAEGPRGTDRPAYLLAGLVTPDVLRRAGAELLAAAS